MFITSFVMSINVHAQTRRGLLAVMCACVVLVVGMVAAINLAIPDARREPRSTRDTVTRARASHD
jgi:hypothetical protein